MDIRKTILYALISIAFAAGTANAGTIYSNDFESGSASGFTGVNNVVTSPDGEHTFLGVLAYGDEAALTLSGLAPHSTVTVSFDLYGLHSLDPDDGLYGPDHFIFESNGTEQIHSPFYWYGRSTTPGYVSDDPNGWGWDFFYGGAAVYHITIDIADSSPDLNLAFIGDTTQPWWWDWQDEGFGIDNLVVSTDAAQVPEPSTVILLGLGLLTAGLISLRARRLGKAR